MRIRPNKSSSATKIAQKKNNLRFQVKTVHKTIAMET